MVNPNINPQEEGLEQERLEEELEQAPLVLPPATPGGPPVVLPRGVVGVPVSPEELGVVVPPVTPAPAPPTLSTEEGGDTVAVPVAPIPSAEPAKEGIKEVNGEDLSDLFDVSLEDVLGDTEEGLDDLTAVSEEDVMGKGGADMSDLVDVSYKDITGYDPAPPSRSKKVVTRKPPRAPRTPPQASMGGMQP